MSTQRQKKGTRDYAWSFSPFDEKAFLLPGFNNNMFCDHGAWCRSKYTSR